DGNGMAAHSLAEALDTPLLRRSASLSSLISALLEQRLFLQSTGKMRLPLTVSVQLEGSTADTSYLTLLITRGLDGARFEKYVGRDVPKAVIREEFALYPSLRTLPEWQGATIEPDCINEGQGWLRLRYRHGQWGPWS